MTETPDLQATTSLNNYPHKNTGRPTIYNESLAEFILSELAGGETLTVICKRPEMPSRQSVLRWRRKFPEFGRQYQLAREDQTEVWGDECVAISDDDTLDTVTKTGKNGAVYEAVDHENIQRSKLRVDTRKFLMSTLNGRYAAKQQVEHTGEVSHTHSVASLSEREKMRRFALFMLEDADIIEGEATTLESGKLLNPASK